MPAPFIPGGLPRVRCGCGYCHHLTRSALFNGSAWLARTFAQAGNLQEFSGSFWLRRGILETSNFNGDQWIFSARAAAYSAHIRFVGSHALYRDFKEGSAGSLSAELFRDVSAWQHHCFSVKSPQGVATYAISGIPLDIPQPSIDAVSSVINTAILHVIGRASPGQENNDQRWLWGYLADFIFVDGYALPPDAFGRFARGVWVPRAYEGPYGATGFHLTFDDAADLGRDASGNDNHWAVHGSVQQTRDTPTNTYCTMDATHWGANVSRGGLRTTTSIVNRSVVGSMFVNIEDEMGWAFKYTHVQPGGRHIGIVRSDQHPHINPSMTAGQMVSYPDGHLYYNGQFLGGTLVYDQVGDEFEMILRSGGVYVRKNGIWVNNGEPLITGLTGRWAPFVNSSNGTTQVMDWDFGQLGYAPPEGAKRICTGNLPCGVAIESGSYVGNGSADGARVWTGCELDSVTIGGTTYYNDGSARGVVDFLASGFKLRSTANNASGVTYTWTGVKRIEQKCANAVMN